MSERMICDWETILMPIRVYCFACDAWDCGNRCDLTVNGDTDELIRVDGEYLDYGYPIADMDDARRYLTEEKGWQEGTRGVQYGHLYCPQHREES